MPVQIIVIVLVVVIVIASCTFSADTAARWQQRRGLSHARDRESWALGRFEMVAGGELTTKSSSPLARAFFCNFTNEMIHFSMKEDMQPYPGGVHGGTMYSVACTAYYVYRKVSAGLAWSVALQVPLIIVCNLPRLMTLGVCDELKLDRS